MFRLISLCSIAVVVLVILVHYLVFGPKHPHKVTEDKHDVHRFSLSERFIHLITALSFLTLVATGFAAAICFGRALTGWLWIVHIAAAPVFAVRLAAIVIRWAQDCRFEEYDQHWVRCFGGYLGGSMDIPAGRFNAGQKAFFWAIASLGLVCILSGLAMILAIFGTDVQYILYQVHRYSALLLIMFVIMHIYLGTLANPGTWQAIITGYVSSHWARCHHRLWWDHINRKGS